MAYIKFIYQQIPFTIQANQNDLFKNIAEKFAQKANVDLETVSFEGDEGAIQENEVIKDLVKQSNEITITVNTNNEEGTKRILVDSKEVICPECKEPCRFQIENYKVRDSNRLRSIFETEKIIKKNNLLNEPNSHNKRYVETVNNDISKQIYLLKKQLLVNPNKKEISKFIDI